MEKTNEREREREKKKEKKKKAFRVNCRVLQSIAKKKLHYLRAVTMEKYFDYVK